MDYRIKQVPEDFVVMEEMELPLGEGRYSYYLLTKKGWTTQGALDRALAYAKERRQFGRPLTDFQAIQHKIADIATNIEAARLMTAEGIEINDLNAILKHDVDACLAEDHLHLSDAGIAACGTAVAQAIRERL